jgi:hypothetical protein
MRNPPLCVGRRLDGVSPHLKIMKHLNIKKTIVGLSLFSIALYSWAQSSADSPRPLKHQAWEHLAFEHKGPSIQGDPKLGRQINQLGDEGWELVDVEIITNSGASSGKIFFFKRPK